MSLEAPDAAMDRNWGLEFMRVEDVLSQPSGRPPEGRRYPTRLESRRPQLVAGFMWNLLTLCRVYRLKASEALCGNRELPPGRAQLWAP